MTSYQKQRSIENKVLFEMKLRKTRFYRFKRIQEWLNGTVNKQELIIALLHLERDGKIEVIYRSNKNLYKVIKRYTV